MKTVMKKREVEEWRKSRIMQSDLDGLARRKEAGGGGGDVMMIVMMMMMVVMAMVMV